ncbi:hypothetical protein [Paraburkholderia sp. JHI869]|uniref:hypothetical protein n=1 Tax=Paraburkholderia sp. JHI869 TaxID=3112959 RepID=UPI00319E5CDB
MSELADFSRLAMTLEPWRKQIVFVGGWAFRLYRYEPRAYACRRQHGSTPCCGEFGSPVWIAPFLVE